MDKLADIRILTPLTVTGEQRGNVGAAFKAVGKGNMGSAFHRLANASNPVPLGAAMKWRGWSERNPVKSIAASFLPMVGGVPNYLDARVNLHQGKYLAALANTASAAIESIPGGALLTKSLKGVVAGGKLLTRGARLGKAVKGGARVYRRLPDVKRLSFMRTLLPNVAAVGGELFEHGRGPNAEPSIYSQMRAGAGARAAVPAGTALGNYRMLERPISGAFGKAASAQPTLGDLLAAISEDRGLGFAERVQISAGVRAAASGAAPGTPLSALMSRGFGGLLAAMAAKYFGVGRLGQAAAGAAGFGLASAAGRPGAGMKDPWAGWKMLG